MAVMAKEFYRFLQTAVSQQSSGSNFYPSTLDIQQSLRCGWLRKQGGVVKSWQRRWFTIKGDHAYYYATSDETKSPLGVIFLPGSRVVEHQFSATDPDKFLFEILPDGGDRQRMAPTHETYLLDAESDEERKEWIKTIKQVLYASVGGAIFGRPLEETLHFEMVRDPRRKVPEIVQLCTEYILKKGLNEEGIFRLPGRTTLIKKICDDFDRGERPEIDVPEMDVHTVASLLKFYLRDLPGPLIPSEFYEPLMRIIMREMPVAEEPAFDRLNELIRSIPVANYNVLQYVCQFLRKIASQSEKNKMTPVNLATIFVQSFIRPEDDDPSLLMATASCRTMATLFLIERAERVFNVEYTSEGGAVVVDDLLGLELMPGQNDPNASEAAPAMSINPDLLGLEINGAEVPSPALRRHNAGRFSQRTASIEVVVGQGLLIVNENNKRGAMILPQVRSSNESSESGSETQSTNDEPDSSEGQKPPPVKRRESVGRKKQPIAPPRPSQQKPKPATTPATITTPEVMIPTVMTSTATTQRVSPPKVTTPATSTKTVSSSVGTDSAAVETLINLDTQNFTESELRAHIERLCRELVVRQKIIEELSEHAQLHEQKHEKQVDALLQSMAKERSKSEKCSKKLQMYMEKYGTSE